MAITLNFACNDPDNGNFIGRFDRMELSAGDLFIEFEGGAESIIEFNFPIRGGYGKVKIGDREWPALAYTEWYGNWCWNAARFTWVEALEIVNYLGSLGWWRMTDGPSTLFEAFNERSEITPLEWKAENEAVRA